MGERMRSHFVAATHGIFDQGALEGIVQAAGDNEERGADGVAFEKSENVMETGFKQRVVGMRIVPAMGFVDICGAVEVHMDGCGRVWESLAQGLRILETSHLYLPGRVRAIAQARGSLLNLCC